MKIEKIGKIKKMIYLIFVKFKFMEHLKHRFKKVGTLEICLICNATRENFYSVPLYTRNGVQWGNYEMNCLNIEELNKNFENSLEF